MHASDYRLPDSTRLGGVRLKVADLSRALRFYRDLLGMRVVSEQPAVVSLSMTGEPPELVRLHEHPGARPRPRGTAGLFHFAILLPDRQSLARTLAGLLAGGQRLHGAADHAVSEAIYLADPDGNGLEIYADRPRDAWRRTDGEIYMTTEPLDIDSLLHEIGTGEGNATASVDVRAMIGHIHLQVPDLEEAEDFYRETLGFDVVTRAYPGALFLSAGGYHHHIGLNVWAGTGVPLPPADAAGLLDFDVVIPSEDALDQLLEQVRSRNADAQAVPGGWRLLEPAGAGIVLRR